MHGLDPRIPTRQEITGSSPDDDEQWAFAGMTEGAGTTMSEHVREACQPSQRRL
jgi:hypothetical protein